MGLYKFEWVKRGGPLCWRLFYEPKIPREEKKRKTNKRIPKQQYTNLPKSMVFFSCFSGSPFWCFTTKKLRNPKKTPLTSTSTPSGSPKKPTLPPRNGVNPATGLVAIHSSEQRRLGQGKLRRQWSRSPSPEGQPTGCWKLLEVPPGISGKTTLETFPPQKKTAKRVPVFSKMCFLGGFYDQAGDGKKNYWEETSL